MYVNYYPNNELSMRLIHVVLSLLVVISILLLFIITAEQPRFSAGIPHAEIKSMMKGGDGMARFIHIGSLSYWLQNSVIVLVLVLISLSIKKARRTALYWLVIGLVGLLMSGAWTMIYLSYQAFLFSGKTDYILGFPVPTAWMLYSVWSSAATLCLFYVIGYRRFIYTPEDQAEFEALVESVKALREKGPM